MEPPWLRSGIGLELHGVGDQGGKAQEEVFDYGILALAPEHLRRFEVVGSAMPIDAVGRLTPAHIVKSNLRSTLSMPEQERATARFAMWFSPDHLRPDRKPMVTFFHGWNGEPMLSPAEMFREAFGSMGPEAVAQFDSQIWDGRPQDGISHFYTTMPDRGEASRCCVLRWTNTSKGATMASV